MRKILLIKLFALTSATCGLVSCGISQAFREDKILSSLNPTIVGDLKEFIMQSPSGNLTPSIIYSPSTRDLHYSLDGQIDNIDQATGKLGFLTTTDNFSNNFLDSVTMTDAQLVEDPYNNFSGKSERVENKYNLYTLTATVGDTGKKMEVDCRVYDDGFAFRYRFDSDGITVTDSDYKDKKYVEQTTFKLFQDPGGVRYIYQRAKSGKYAECYESSYENMDHDDGSHDWRVFPLLETKVASGYSVLFSEAGLDGTYTDSYLFRIGDHNFQVMPSYQQLNYKYNKTSKAIPMNNFTSPWRAFIIGNYGDIVTSELIEALNEECAVEDTSWIQPGTTAWSWKMEEGFDGQSDEEVHKKYIDFASEMGWKYYTLDEGWPLRTSNDVLVEQGFVNPDVQDTDHFPHGDYMYAIRPNTTRLVQYAKERNVGLFAWIHNSQLCDPTADYAKMDGLFASLSAAGFKGLKVDFFEYPSHNLDIQLRKMYEKAAKYHLLINVHGSNLPTGERRTFPNVINREAIGGEIESKWINPTLLLSNAYVRCAAGPADFTPYVNAHIDSHLVLASQMAIPILIESGSTCIASNSEVFRDGYITLNKQVKNFYRNLPSSWKKTVYISGTPNLNAGGDLDYSLVLARQTKNNDWYVGGIFDGKPDTEKTYTLDCSFLGDGTYRAEIYRGTNHTYQLKGYELLDNVTKNTKIDFPICDNGGFVTRITNRDNKINIDSSLFTINAYRDGTTPIVSGEYSQLGHKINLDIIAPSADLLPEYAYVNGDPFYIKRDESDPTKGTVSGINEVYQNINISIKPPADTRTVSISCSAGGSVVVCDDLRKYYKNGDAVKIGATLTISFKYNNDLYDVALSINETSITLADDEYSFVIEDSYPNISIKVTYTPKS